MVINSTSIMSTTNTTRIRFKLFEITYISICKTERKNQNSFIIKTKTKPKTKPKTRTRVEVKV